MKILLAIALCALSHSAIATTFYVRGDGGTLAQCDGKTDAPLAGAAGTHCGWNHPFVALPPINGEHHTSPRIASGDTLVIDAGQYQMGFPVTGVPETSACYSNDQADCVMQPAPAGVTIVGAGYATGCASPPQLWADAGAYTVINMVGSSGSTLKCVEVTDHDSCAINHCVGSGCTTVARCGAGMHFGNLGILISDAHDVTFQDVNVHGMGGEGVRGGRLTNFTATNLRIYGNAFAGWDGDLRNNVPTADTSNHGAINFARLFIAWNGCIEKYPTTGTQADIFGCWDQNEGGYGDGLGTGPTSGNWTFTDTTIVDNVSDGLDLLYADGTGSINVANFVANGNAGNQLKVSGPTTIDHAQLDGTCAQPWSTLPANNQTVPATGVPPFAGKYNMELGGNCRASGDVLATALTPGATIKLLNSTLTGQSSGLFLTTKGTTAPGASIFIGNSILAAKGQIDWQMYATGGGVRSIYGFYDYEENAPANYVPIAPTVDHSITWGLKFDQTFPGATNVDPLFSNPSPIAFNPVLLPASPAIAAGNPAYCGGAACNIGGTTGGVVPPQQCTDTQPATTPACAGGGNQIGGTWSHGTYPGCGWTYIGGVCPVVPPPVAVMYPAGQCTYVTPAKPSVIACTLKSCPVKCTPK